MDYIAEFKGNIDITIDKFRDIPRIIAKSFIQININNNKLIYDFERSNCLLKIPIKEFKEILLNEWSFTEIYKAVINNNSEQVDVDTVSFYGNNDCVIQLSFLYKNRKKDKIFTSLECLSTNKQYIDYIKLKLNEYAIFTDDDNELGDDIYLLKSDRNGVSLVSIGTSKIKYIPENYSIDVQNKYTHLIEDLVATNPCGRLNILSGEPGTGKTFLVKSLLSSGEDVSFIIVKPDAIESISDPSCIPALINHHSMHDRPMVIVLEDADSCLSTRMGDNMSRLSAILNTSDGILGSTLDIRIIATTNAKKVDFDSAILRPGRLCTHITTDRLDEEQSNLIFTRLTGKSFEDAEIELTKKSTNITLGFSGRSNKNPGYILAEIYKAAYTYNKSK